MLRFAAMAAPGAASPWSIYRSFPPAPSLSLRACAVRASLAPALPSKTTPDRRKSKNYLRRKLLKTLNPLPGDPAQLREQLSRQKTPIEVPSHEEDLVEEQVCEVEELVYETTASEPSFSDNLEPISARSVIGLSLGLVGLFFIQTAVAVLFLGYSGGNGIKSSLAAITDGESETEAARRKAKEFGEGMGVFNDGSEMEIMGIREMAREARASERMKLANEAVKRNGDESVTKAAAFGVIADIEKEIDVRLRKLKKNASSGGQKQRNPLTVVSNLSTPETGVRTRKHTKSGSRSQKLKKSENSTEIASESGRLVAETKSARSTSQNHQMPAPKKFGTAVNTGEDNKSARKLRSKLKHNGKGSCPDVEKNEWWRKLPYVLVILLQNMSDGEGPRGFFSLKIKANADGKINSSYTIAFEDHGDANNFCYIVESFFEDLGDVRADTVPLLIEEFERELVSSSKKVVVVRKGQLKLYAGQPLTDVEKALYSLMD